MTTNVDGMGTGMKSILLIEGITCDDFNNMIFIILGMFVASFDMLLIFPSLYISYFPLHPNSSKWPEKNSPHSRITFMSNLRRLNLANYDCSGTLGDFGNLSN